MHQILRQNKEQWDIFTRKEEYSRKDLDIHGRFTYALSSSRDILNPGPSQYLTNSGFKIDYPDDRKFAVCLTHDVDEVYPPLNHALLSSLHYLKDLNFTGIRNQFFWKIDGKQSSPYINFQEIMALEERYDAKSTFYFIAAERDFRRFRYKIEDLEDDLGRIADRGWDVGLHGSYYAYNDLIEMKREKARLEKTLGREVIGYRNHYLRFRVPETWELLAKAGFRYDTTLGYSDAVGFRGGMCHPFRPYDLNSEKPIDILEIPLCIMDTALFDLEKRTGSMWKTIENLMKVAEKYGGVLTLLWHNDTFSSPFKGSLCRLYIKALAHAKEKGAWITSADEIWRWLNDY